MFQILPQRRLVKLREELSGNGGIKPANIINQLTFTHGEHTFQKSPIWFL